MKKTKPAGSRPIGKPDPKKKAAERGVQALRHRYKLGVEAFKSSLGKDGKHAPKTIRKIAAKAGRREYDVRQARLFAGLYNPEEFEALCGLRTPEGAPLTFSHVRLLLTVEDKEKRSSLQLEAAEKGWRVKLLKDAINRLKTRQSEGGRPLRKPSSQADALGQISTHAEEWLRRCEKVWSVGEPGLFTDVEVSTQAERETFQASLEHARSLLRKLGRLALNLENQIGQVKIQVKSPPSETPPPKPASGRTARTSKKRS